MAPARERELHAGSHEAFAQAWHLWEAGAHSDSEVLPTWRIYDLEASLRRDQRRFPEALRLLEQAQAVCGKDPLAAGRILLKKEHVLADIGDARGALAVLAEAAPFIEASSDTRQIFALRFNMVADLCHLESYEEAAKLLPQVHQLALGSGNELDLIRVVWLRSRVEAGLGRTEEAITSLERVGRDFTARGLPYDAALSWLVPHGRMGNSRDEETTIAQDLRPAAERAEVEGPATVLRPEGSREYSPGPRPEADAMGQRRPNGQAA